jgi:hypothetical protein
LTPGDAPSADAPSDDSDGIIREIPLPPGENPSGDADGFTVFNVNCTLGAPHWLVTFSWQNAPAGLEVWYITYSDPPPGTIVAANSPVSTAPAGSSPVLDSLVSNTNTDWTFKVYLWDPNTATFSDVFVYGMSGIC